MQCLSWWLKIFNYIDTYRNTFKVAQPNERLRFIDTDDDDDDDDDSVIGKVTFAVGEGATVCWGLYPSNIYCHIICTDL